jgi:arylsulfatase A-like enzyme
MGQSIPAGVRRTERFIAGGGTGEKAMRDWAMIRSGDYKYVCYCGDRREEELYHLAEDPDELTNLADAAHADLVAEMRRKTARELRATRSGFDGGHFIDFFPLLRDLPQ